MKRSAGIIVLIVVVGLLGYLWFGRNTAQQSPGTKHQQTQTERPPADQFDKQLYSLTDPASPWVIVNKSHPLNPKGYVPDDLVLPAVPQRLPGADEMKLRAAAAKDVEALFSGADQADLPLIISTAYRSYRYQSALYNGYVAQQGQAQADRQSARPGYSEHQTGLAVDIRAQSGRCSIEQCFGNQPEGKWLAANAYKYGFILRYPKGKESITGYEYEPWHFRYVGRELARELHQRQVPTLEEFFAVSGGTRYR